MDMPDDRNRRSTIRYRVVEVAVADAQGRDESILRQLRVPCAASGTELSGTRCRSCARFLLFRLDRKRSVMTILCRQGGD